MNFAETTSTAINSIRANKLRSVLTLVGIVVGVFSIIGVMTTVRVLESSIESGLSGLGSHTFQIQRWPVTFSREAWRKARKWKKIEYPQAMELKRRTTLAQYVAIEGWEGAKVVQFGARKTNPNVSVVGEEPEGIETNSWEIRDGRSFNELDLYRAAKVTILGEDVVNKLFPAGGAVGSKVKIDNEWYRVIGTFEPKGSLLGGDNDNRAVIPLTALLASYGKRMDLHVMVKSRSPEEFRECLEEVRSILRMLRKTPPLSEDDFTIFSNDTLIETFEGFTLYVKIGIGFISFVALIAAGVGIMNIMLVSVTERTREIGIRKAVGARKSNILAQFLGEALILCQLGGIVGVLLGVLAGNLGAVLLDIPPSLPWDWSLIGFLLCAIIGVGFGIYPAWKAANLDPIDALRYE